MASDDSQQLILEHMHRLSAWSQKGNDQVLGDIATSKEKVSME